MTGQLALAHTYGSGEEDSCENTVLAVSNLLYGMEIDHYVSLTMDGVALLNDLVGGVTVEVLDDFSGIDDTLVQGETVTLKGQQALTYVRSRGGLEGQLQPPPHGAAEAVSGRLAAAAEEGRPGGQPVLPGRPASSSTSTWCPTAPWTSSPTWGDNLAAYQVGDILTTPGEAREGEEFMEFTVDEDALQQLVMDVFYEPVEES